MEVADQLEPVARNSKPALFELAGQTRVQLGNQVRVEGSRQVFDLA
jgi:hypothetical protein